MNALRVLASVPRRLKYWANCPRIGPDVPLTHWMLHFPELASRLASRKLAAFGEGSSIRPGSYLVETASISIGRNVVIRPNTMLMASPVALISIGNDVLIGSGVHIIASNHNFDDPDRKIADQGHDPDKAGVRIDDDVWIGANAILLAGVHIGRHSVVAAGSIVNRDVPPFSVVGGVPAKLIRRIPVSDHPETDT